MGSAAGDAFAGRAAFVEDEVASSALGEVVDTLLGDPSSRSSSPLPARALAPAPPLDSTTSTSSPAPAPASVSVSSPSPSPSPSAPPPSPPTELFSSTLAARELDRARFRKRGGGKGTRDQLSCVIYIGAQECAYVHVRMRAYMYMREQH